MAKNNYTVIRDTQEKDGYKWDFSLKNGCDAVIDQHLKTGDYTLVGYEDKFVIERKRNTGEIVSNLFSKRFIKELERLEKFEHPFVICEFLFEDILNFPANSGIPVKKWQHLKITPQSFLCKFNQINLKYKTKFLFAGSAYNAKCLAVSLFKRVVENV